jgi:putative transposase
MSAFCESLEMSCSTLKRWIKEHRDGGIEALVDTRGGNIGVKGFSREAADMFKSLYLDQRRPSAKTCLQTVVYYNSANDCGWSIPALRSIHKWINDHIPAAALILHREGVAAYEARCAPFIQSDPDSYAPGECWVGDHHQLNFWVRHRQRWIRPWLTMWMDYRSRKPVGWVMCTSPNQTTILRAFGRGAATVGLPSRVKIDNGRDYDSQMWTGTTKAKRRVLGRGYMDEKLCRGLYAMMDVSVSFSIPYHPQSKPVERFFATVDTQFSKQIETYCGADSARKPEYVNDMLKSKFTQARGLTLESASKLIEKWFDAYSNTVHKGAGMDATPNEVFSRRVSRRSLAKGTLELLLQVWSGEIKVGKNGIRFNNMLYGQFDAQVMAYHGSSVRIAYNPDDISTINVYDAVTMKLLTVAAQNELIKLGDAASEDAMRDAQRAKARARRAVKEYKPAAVVSRKSLPELTIEAQRAMSDTEPAGPDDNASMIELVRTPLDGQLGLHREMRRLKKAAGAETDEHEIKLDLLSVAPHEGEIDLGLL